MTEAIAAGQELSVLAIKLLKGVIYQNDDPPLWQALLRLHARIRDYMAVLGLEMVLDEAEGYAFLRAQAENEDDATLRLPRLVARRPLSFPVSLLLALLREKLAEHDAGGADTLLVLSREQIADALRLFLPDGSNEVKLLDQVDAHINKILELGFLRKLKAGAGQAASFEVRRILKAFVDAQWLAEFDSRLAAYREQLADKASE